MVLSSLKTNVQATAYPPVWLFRPTLQNYVDVFTKNPFFSYMVNSTIIAGAAVGIGWSAGCRPPTAWPGIARRRWVPGAHGPILPGIAFLVPLFVIYRRLGPSTPSAASSSPTSSSSCR